MTPVHDAPIWLLGYLDEIEVVQTKYYQPLLNLPRNTTNYTIRLGTIGLTQEYESIARALKWWMKLLEISEYRLPSKKKLTEAN